MSWLSDRNREIVKARLGFDARVHTLEEIGDRYDLTRQRIEQILNRWFPVNPDAALVSGADGNVWSVCFKTAASHSISTFSRLKIHGSEDSRNPPPWGLPSKC